MQRRRLVRIIEEYALRKKMTIDIVDTAKVSELIQNIESESADQLYFLDIDIKNESKKGLEIAQEIRKLDNRGTIVFVTTHSEFAPITYKYKVSALDFIDKSDPEMIKRVEESIFMITMMFLMMKMISFLYYRKERLNYPIRIYITLRQ